MREEGEINETKIEAKRWGERGGRLRERQRNGVREEGENGVRHFR